MLVLDFKMDYRLNNTQSCFCESIEERKGCFLYIKVRITKLLLVSNCLTSSTYEFYGFSGDLIKTIVN